MSIGRNWYWLLVLAACCNRVLAQVTTEDLPPCAVNCFQSSTAVNASLQSCEVGASVDFEDLFSPCYYDACPVLDALTALNITSILCNQPVRDISWALRGSVIGATVLASMVVGLRVILKFRGLAGGVGWDDWTILVAVFVTLDAAIGQFLAAWFGMGRDQWKVPQQDISTVYKCFLISAVGYKLGNAATRISLLCFYWRVFRSSEATMIIVALIVLSVVIGVTFGIADALQCQPASSFWNGWDGELAGHCGSLSAISWTHSIINIVLDMATLALAFWMVHKLNMRWRKKAAVISMFLLGSAITLVTFLRLQSLPRLSNTRNRTWNMAPISYWSTIEMLAGVTCACLPALKVLGTMCCGKRQTSQFGSSGPYERQASLRRPRRSKSLDPTATFSENDEYSQLAKSQEEQVGTRLMDVVPEGREYDIREGNRGPGDFKGINGDRIDDAQLIASVPPAALSNHRWR